MGVGLSTSTCTCKRIQAVSLYTISLENNQGLSVVCWYLSNACTKVDSKLHIVNCVGLCGAKLGVISKKIRRSQCMEDLRIYAFW